MTKQRMEDILVALEQDGWRFVGTDDPGGDRFALRDETVRWSVVRGDSPDVVELEFRAYGPLGQSTECLGDIFFVQVLGGDETLHFEKRTRPEWRSRLRTFVLALNRLAERRRSEHRVRPALVAPRADASPENPGERSPRGRDSEGVQMELLLDDRWAPITTEFGFVEAPLAVVSDWWGAWQNRLLARGGRGVRSRELAGELEVQLAALLPLSVVEARRVLMVPTRSAWTAVFANGHQGGDAAGLAVAARALGCRAVRVVNAPHVVAGGTVRRYGARIFELYGPEVPGLALNTLRALSVANDGGRWRMDVFGPPLHGEDPAWFAAKSVRNRFLPEHLAAILRSLGIDAFDASFYGSPGVLIERWGPPVRGYHERTLEEVQAEWRAVRRDGRTG